jgi:hypothetical protein
MVSTTDSVFYSLINKLRDGAVVYLALPEPVRGDLEVNDLASPEVRLGALESSHNLTNLSLQ